MVQEDNQDIDLTHVFRKIGNTFNYLGTLFLRGIAFLIRNVLIILGLLLIGTIIGFFWQRQQKHTQLADIVVYANVGSSDYLYDAIELLNLKIEQRDTSFLRGFGLVENNKPILKAVEVNPVVNIRDILSSYSGFDDDQVVLLLENVNSKGSFFEDKVFINAYSFHKIELKLFPGVSAAVIQQTLNYLEDNQYLQQKLEVERQNLKHTENANEYTLKQIDTLVVNYNRSLIRDTGQRGQIEISGNNGMNFNEILRTKSNILSENNDIAKDLLRLDRIFHVINKPKIFDKSSILDLKILLLPFALVFLFIMFHIIVRLSRKIQTNINNGRWQQSKT